MEPADHLHVRAGVDPGGGRDRDHDRACLDVARLATGDFNGDSRTDLAIGVPFEDVGDADADADAAGAVHVLYGASAGLTGTGRRLFTQNSAGMADSAEGVDQFGAALAAGDINGDGWVDLAIGVPGETLATGPGTHNGIVQVMYGASAGLTGTGSQLFRQGADGVGNAPQDGDQFGTALAAGDFNGDGRADLAIGVPYEDFGVLAEAGVLHVLYGTANKLTGVGSQCFYQGRSGLSGEPVAWDRFSEALTAGDYNGDGRDDLAIGVPGAIVDGATGAGQVQVLYSNGVLSGVGELHFDQGTGSV